MSDFADAHETYYRQVFVELKNAGMNEHQIAEHLGITPAAVRALKARI